MIYYIQVTLSIIDYTIYNIQLTLMTCILYNIQYTTQKTSRITNPGSATSGLLRVE